MGTELSDKRTDADSLRGRTEEAIVTTKTDVELYLKAGLAGACYLLLSVFGLQDGTIMCRTFLCDTLMCHEESF